jgi:hypothetical protein
MQRFLAARRKLEKKLERAPTTTELGDELGISRERASQLLAAAGLPTYRTSIKLKRAELKPIPREIKGSARVLLENIRRLYRAEIKRDDARSDAEFGRLFGASGRPDQMAAQFRRLLSGRRPPPVIIVDLAAAAFNLREPADLLRPRFKFAALQEPSC